MPFLSLARKTAAYGVLKKISFEYLSPIFRSHQKKMFSEHPKRVATHFSFFWTKTQMKRAYFWHFFHKYLVLAVTFDLIPFCQSRFCRGSTFFLLFLLTPIMTIYQVMLIQAIMAIMATLKWPNMSTSMAITGAYAKSRTNVDDP